MKLYEIENYYIKKLTCEIFKPDYYILLKKGLWYDNFGREYGLTDFEIENYDWKEYKEPKKPRRFWQWILSHNNNLSYYRTGQYVDELGYTSLSNKYSEHWKNYNKHKIETDWIDVDSNGNLVNWAGKE